MPTVTLNKIVNKFIYGEIAQMKNKGETMPLNYLALLQECSTLEDLILTVDDYYDMRSRASAAHYILTIMDYEEED